MLYFFFFFFQAEDGIRDIGVTGVQTCALPISPRGGRNVRRLRPRGGQQGLCPVYALDGAIAGKVTFCCYLCPAEEDPAKAPDSGGASTSYRHAGGGYDAYPMMRALLGRLQDRRQGPSL